jgi:endonuclease/exonuclease/phosphatase family metal-dependent hydrolase
MRKIISFCGIVILVLSVITIGSAPAFAVDKQKVKVMTRNLYLGGDIFKLVDAAQTNPTLIPWVVAEVFQTMLQSNFRARAEAIADEIANTSPQVIGLQEVSTFYIQTPGDIPFGNPNPAEEIVIDFYTVLNDALEARGLYYDDFSVTNSDVELPMLDINSPTYLSDVRMVDHDYVLVRKGHRASEVLADNYSTNIGLDLGDVYVEFTRGFVIVDVDVKGETFRFVNTHLEVNSEPESVFRFVQSAQMQELLDTIDGLQGDLGSAPVIMVGDLNSSPEDVPGNYSHPFFGSLPYVPPYMQAIAAEYLDSWLLQSKYDEGYTSGFEETIDDPNDTLEIRFDHIFLDPDYLVIDKVSSNVIGDKPSDMVPNPDCPGKYLWPSDHAGVVGKIKFLP